MSQPASANVAVHLPEMARRQPDTPAIYIPVGQDSQQQTRYAQYSFAELDRKAAVWRWLFSRSVSDAVCVRC